MIKLTRLDGREFVLNCDLIESLEANPNTVLSLRTEKKILVKETINEIIERIVTYKQTIYTTPYFKAGNKTYLNSSEPDIFFTEQDAQRMKDKDIKYLDEDEEEDYEDDEE